MRIIYFLILLVALLVGACGDTYNVYENGGSHSSGTVDCDDLAQAQVDCMKQPGWDHKGMSPEEFAAWADSVWAVDIAAACRKGKATQECINCVVNDGRCQPNDDYGQVSPLDDCSQKCNY